MGILKPCFSVSGDSVEVAVIRLYDESTARTVAGSNFGFDDLTGEPLFGDTNSDGIGERVRPETEVEIKAKIEWSKNEEQNQDGIGNAPSSFLKLTIFDEELESLGLYTAGKIGIRPNDRLIRIQSQAGAVRYDFTSDGRDGVHCVEVRPGETGTRVTMVFFENRRPVSR